MDTRMTENELAKVAVDVAFHVHSRLGPGLLESVYHAVVVYELQARGLQTKCKWPVPIVWGRDSAGQGF